MHRYFLGSFVVVTALLLAAIAAVGWLVDPFGHFASPDERLDRKPVYTLNRSLFKLVEFKRVAATTDGARPLHVLVGDSIANQLEPLDLARATGEAWFNFSYGAATLAENITLLRALLARRDVEIADIVWSLPFTKLRHSPKNTIPRSLRMARQPWLHLFTHESLLATYYVLRKHWFKIDFQDEVIDMPDADRIDYFLYRMRVDLEGVDWPEDLVREVSEIEALARARGVALSFMVPPVHPRAREIFATEFAERYTLYRRFLAGHCVRDVEALVSGRLTAATFADAVHLKVEHRPVFLAAFVSARRQPCSGAVSGTAVAVKPW